MTTSPRHTEDHPPAWSRGEAWYLVSLLLLALVFRALFISQVREGVVFHSYQLDHLDNHFFYSWAKEVAAGDWLSRGGYHPYHFWHKRFGTPEEWRRWYGGAAFHQAPLYPYFLAAVFALGGSPLTVAILQSLSGVALILMVYLLARRLFSVGAARAAAVLALFYGPFYVYETQLLRTSLSTAGGIALLLACLKARDKDRLSAWFGVGFLMGVLVLFKESFLLRIAFLILWMVLVVRPRIALRRAVIGVFIGLVLCSLPLFLRNAIVRVPVASFSSVGPVTFTFGNAADVTGTEFQTSIHTREIMTRGGGKWWPTIRATLATHPGAPSVIAQLGRKIAAFWDGYETPNNANYYYAKLHSPFLRWGTYSFSVLGPLAILGLVMSLSSITDHFSPCGSDIPVAIRVGLDRGPDFHMHLCVIGAGRNAPPTWRELLLLYLYIASVLCQTLLFYHISRFRIAAIPVFAVFGGLALMKIGEALKGANKTRGLLMIALILALHVLLSLQERAKGKIPSQDFLIVAGLYAYAQQGNASIALHELALADRLYPEVAEAIEYFRRDVLRLQRESARQKNF